MASLATLFRNARISTKVFVAPVCITLFMLAMAAAAFYGADQQGRALRKLTTETMPKSMAAVQASDLVVLAQLDLYRTVSWAVNSQDEKKIEESLKRTRENLNRAQEALAAIATRWTLTQEDATQRDAAAAALKEYAAAAENVLDMAASDATTAFVFLLAVEKAYGTVKTSLDALRDVQARQTDETSAAAVRTEERARLLLLSLLGVALALAAVVTLTVARMISRPIAGMTGAMTALAGGDQSVEIPGTGRKDEVGRMADAVQVFKTGMIEAERLRAEQANTEARAEAERQAAMRRLASEFEQAVGSIVATVSSAAGELEQAAGSLSRTANVTGELSGSAAAASEQASANVQSVASAAE